MYITRKYVYYKTGVFQPKNVCILTNFDNLHTPMKIYQTPFIMINLDEYHFSALIAGFV